MKHCETVSRIPEEHDGHTVWCATHNLPADCYSLDQWTLVCEVYARIAGSNNKPEYARRGEMALDEIIRIELSNRDDSETTAKVLRALRKEARRQLDKLYLLEQEYHELVDVVED